MEGQKKPVVPRYKRNLSDNICIFISSQAQHIRPGGPAAGEKSDIRVAIKKNCALMIAKRTVRARKKSRIGRALKQILN